MALPAFVQTLTGNTSAGSGSFTTAAFGSSLTNGNLVVITVADDAGVINKITSITDSAGNTYAQIFSTAATDSLSMWYCANIKGGASTTVTVTYSAVSITNVSITAQEFAGMRLAAVIADKSVSATGTSTAPNSGATGITNGTAELVVGGVCYVAAGGAATLGGGYTNLGNETTNVTLHSAQESKAVWASGTQTANFTITSAAWICGTATFYVAHQPLTNNYQFIQVGDGMSVSEKIR